MRRVIRRIWEMLGWSSLLAVLVIGVPLFICMPLWVDTTYHDLSARNILRGGVHYRDIFETNLPGMVWLHAIVRPIVGWSSEAIRAVDLVFVGSSVLLLAAWLKRIGVTRSAIVWFLAASSMFYLFETEFIHCQRDGWMLLPTIIAMHLRGRQIAGAGTASRRRLFGRGLIEGMFWGSAIWIKPHSSVPAFAIWLLSLRRLVGQCGNRSLFDLLGLLTGGAIVGTAGVVWLLTTGAWPYMWDVLLNWNPEYYKWTMDEMDHRVSMIIMYFAPWSLVHLVAIPVAFIALVRFRFWRLGPYPWMKPARLDQALLAMLYLGWFVEAVFLQKTFHYSQTPVHFLAFALLTAHRWPISPIFMAWCLIGATLIHYKASNATVQDWLEPFKRQRPFTYQQVVPFHRLINDDWRSVWYKCLTEGSSPAIQDHLSFYRLIHCAPTWTELEQVHQYLQTLNLKDGELVCWDDTTHPLYLSLNLRPSFRFMHVNTSLEFRSKRPRLREELIATGHKYVVSDTAVSWFLYDYYSQDTPPDRPLDLPLETPCFVRDVYPWNQPIVFKCGRYWVHRIDNPITEIRIPYAEWR